MKPLMERLLGRPSRDERRADPAPPPATAEPDAAASGDAGAAPAAAHSRASVIQALRYRVAEGSRGRLRAHEIHEDAQLFDRGYLDSFSYVEFLVFIEERYRVRIDDSQLAGHLSTLATMADHILREQPSSAE